MYINTSHSQNFIYVHFQLFMLFVYFFEPFHVPLLLLLVFVRAQLYHKVSESIESRFFFRQRSMDSDGVGTVANDSAGEEEDDLLEGGGVSYFNDKICVFNVIKIDYFGYIIYFVFFCYYNTNTWMCK